MASAQPLTFVTYMSPGATGWDRSATYSSTQPFALSRDDFAITLTRGATYDIFSASYFDPFVLRIQDSSGNLLANDVGSSFFSYGTDVIFDFVPQYTGTYYISASWGQGSFDKFVWLAVYEDLDTVPKVPSSPMITVNRGGVTSQEEALPYSGPVVYLQYQYLGTQLGEVAIGTNNNDFINLLGGDDAANAGAGDDVIDGGTGSNFLSGGSGKDVFFSTAAAAKRLGRQLLIGNLEKK
jgi:Ca2+-binding RTX toxin-like protein